MSDRNKCNTTRNPLVIAVVREFESGVEVIRTLDDLVYRKAANGTGSVGGHFRHNLDFANSFLNGISEGKIDYNKRERDVRVEEDRQYALEKVTFAAKRIESLAPELLERFVMIRSELDRNIWHASSVSRELEFLLSHTVHHHAMIAEKLAGFGIAIEGNFGVAVSTLQYWKQKAA
ncbi:MAG: hypothetical protein ACT4O9_16320 [Blastocatellia bacterium]